MKKYTESDYMKNKKNKAAIIYSHNGCTEILTYERVSESDNGISKEEFLKFKSLSDKMFHEIHKGDDVESKHISATYNDEIIDDLTATVSPEDELIEKEENKSKKSRCEQAIDTLTEVQLRRVMMYASGMSMDKIAKEEQCGKNAVKKSLNQAKEKFLKFFPERGCTKR